jgi:hypothetical protein
MKNGNEIRSREELITLPVPLTPEEVRIKGVSLAVFTERWNETKAAAKLTAAEYKKLLDEISDEAKVLTSQIRSLSEMRDVLCDVEFNYSTKMVTVSRQDTGGIVEHRPMTDREAQQEMDI